MMNFVPRLLLSRQMIEHLVQIVVKRFILSQQCLQLFSSMPMCMLSFNLLGKVNSYHLFVVLRLLWISNLQPVIYSLDSGTELHQLGDCEGGPSY
jgi:hypothetical protein